MTILPSRRLSLASLTSSPDENEVFSRDLAPCPPADLEDRLVPTARESLTLAPPPSVEVSAPTGFEAKSFAAVLAKLGLTEAAKDGVITLDEADAVGVAFAPLMAAARRGGDLAKLDGYDELLAAIPEVKPLTAAELQSPATHADYVVFAPKWAHEALQPLLRHREMKGHDVALVDPADVAALHGKAQASVEDLTSFLDQARATWAEPKPRFVLLVGDARKGEVPAEQLSAGKDGHAYMYGAMVNKQLAKTSPGFKLPEVFSSDNGYGRPNKRGVPSLAVGRLPVHGEQELGQLASRIIDYEAKAPAGPWQARVDVSDGDPMWGKSMSKLVDGFSRAALRDEADPAFELKRISHNPNEPTAATANDAQKDALEQGALFFQYYGHGLSTGIDGLSVTDVAALHGKEPLPLVAIMACLTGQFAGGIGNTGTSLTEELVTHGPALSAIGASDVSLPHSNVGLGAALGEEVLSGKASTVGELMVAAKRRYEKNDLEGVAKTVNGVGHAAWTAGRLFKHLGDDERSHLYLYNLMGDPGLELRRPAPAQVALASKTVSRAQPLQVTLSLPPDLRDGVAYVSFDVPGATGKPGSTSALSMMVPVKDGQLAAPLELPPSMRKGVFNLRIAVVADAGAAAGAVEGVRITD